MSLASLKTSSEPESYAMSSPQYGYGTMISLTEDQVEALGLKDYPPATGSTVGIRAIAVVISKTENADVDGDGDGVDVCLCLQLTDMEVTPGAQTMTGAATSLYSGDND